MRDGEETELIQVTYASGMDEIASREVKNLFRAMESLGLKEGTLVTWDYSGEVELNGLRVNAIPLWRWLLNS
ncbi:hypothetical protein [Thermococcus zilligii]|uniref:hypothetical protein n=1 Tax=Thermococcus zilligii TaxID=54076 RepID=UPI00029B34FA|nr:hypothetical protein [Thermococcus zilligii]